MGLVRYIINNDKGTSSILVTSASLVMIKRIIEENIRKTDTENSMEVQLADYINQYGYFAELHPIDYTLNISSNEL